MRRQPARRAAPRRNSGSKSPRKMKAFRSWSTQGEIVSCQVSSPTHPLSRRGRFHIHQLRLKFEP